MAFYATHRTVLPGQEEEKLTNLNGTIDVKKKKTGAATVEVLTPCCHVTDRLLKGSVNAFREREIHHVRCGSVTGYRTEGSPPSRRGIVRKKLLYTPYPHARLVPGFG